MPRSSQIIDALYQYGVTRKTLLDRLTELLRLKSLNQEEQQEFTDLEACVSPSIHRNLYLAAKGFAVPPFTKLLDDFARQHGIDGLQPEAWTTQTEGGPVTRGKQGNEFPGWKLELAHYMEPDQDCMGRPISGYWRAFGIHLLTRVACMGFGASALDATVDLKDKVRKQEQELKIK